TERCADREPAARLGQGGSCGGDQFIRIGTGQVEVHAELVAAEPVGAAGSVDRATQPLSQTREQLVSGRMTECVVVRLEAVEVEKQEQGAIGNIRVLLECRAQIGG